MTAMSNSKSTANIERRRLFSPRTFNTLAATALVLMLLTYLLGYSDTDSALNMSPAVATDIERDYYLTNAYSQQFDQQGKLDTTAVSAQVDHNPTTDHITMQQPLVKLYRDGEHSWTIQATLGVVKKGGRQIDLEQQVRITSSDNSATLSTSRLSIFPNKKLAKTDQPVTLVAPNGITRAIGLNADLGSKTIHLLQQVRGQYQGVPSHES